MHTIQQRLSVCKRRWRGWGEAVKFDHLVIMVRSLDVSLPWYETMLSLLGFTKTRDHVWSGKDGVAIDLREAKPGTSDYERFAPGLNHLGFTASDETAHDALRAAIAEGGFEVPDKQVFGEEGTATFFRDPDGMRIEIAVYF